LKLDGVKDMISTLSSLPPERSVPIRAWIAIMSILPAWIAIAQFIRTRGIQKRKNSHNSQLDTTALKAE